MRMRRACTGPAALALAAATVGVYGWFLARGNPDPAAFAATGERLLSRQGLSVFDNSYLQVGPLYLLVEGVVGRLGGVLGTDPLLALSVTWSVALMFWTRATATALAAERPSMRGSLAMWTTGLTLLFALPLVCASGHFEEMATVLALLSAGIMAGRGRPGIAGLLIAVAAGVKAWGVLGLPLVLLCRRRGEGGLMTAVALGASGLVYGPFLLTGHVATAAHAWHVTAPSALSLVLAPGTAFGASARVVQLAAGLTVGAVVAWRRRAEAATAAAGVLTAAIAVRLLTDPYPQSYYVAPLLMALASAVVVKRGTGSRGAVELLAVMAGLDLAFAAPGVTGSVLQLGACGLAAAMAAAINDSAVVNLGGSAAVPAPSFDF